MKPQTHRHSVIEMLPTEPAESLTMNMEHKMSQFVQAAVTKCHRLGNEHQTLVLHSSEGWTSAVRAPAGLSESSLTI